MQTGFYFAAMDPIPVNFKHNGVTYNDCYFTRVSRNGESEFWHLYDYDNSYLGRLRFADQWTFDANKRTTKIEELAEFFGDIVEKSKRKRTA